MRNSYNKRGSSNKFWQVEVGVADGGDGRAGVAGAVALPEIRRAERVVAVGFELIAGHVRRGHHGPLRVGIVDGDVQAGVHRRDEVIHATRTVHVQAVKPR